MRCEYDIGNRKVVPDIRCIQPSNWFVLRNIFEMRCWILCDMKAQPPESMFMAVLTVARLQGIEFPDCTVDLFSTAIPMLPAQSPSVDPAQKCRVDKTKLDSSCLHSHSRYIVETRTNIIITHELPDGGCSRSFRLPQHILRKYFPSKHGRRHSLCWYIDCYTMLVLSISFIKLICYKCILGEQKTQRDNSWALTN